MTDDQIEELSFDIDGELNRLMIDHEIHPLSLCAIVLARSLVFLSDMGCKEDYKKLIVETVLKDRYESRTLQ